MNTFALDTNIISYLLKMDAHIVEMVSKETSAGHKLIIPPIAYYEIKRGLLAVNATVKMEVFERLCSKNVVGEINRAVLDEAAGLHATLRRAGRPIDDADLLIAAFCIVHEYTLITNNPRHFEHIDGLQLANWI